MERKEKKWKEKRKRKHLEVNVERDWKMQTRNRRLKEHEIRKPTKWTVKKKTGNELEEKKKLKRTTTKIRK